jgi:hypothetical protein
MELASLRASMQTAGLLNEAGNTASASSISNAGCVGCLATCMACVAALLVY